MSFLHHSYVITITIDLEPLQMEYFHFVYINDPCSYDANPKFLLDKLHYHHLENLLCLDHDALQQTLIRYEYNQTYQNQPLSKIHILGWYIALLVKRDQYSRLQMRCGNEPY